MTRYPLSRRQCATTWLGRFGLSESPTTATVFAPSRIRSITSSRESPFRNFLDVIHATPVLSEKEGAGHRFLDTLGKKRFNFPLPFRRGSQLKEAIAKMLKEGADLRLQMIETMTGDILEAAKTIADTFKAGRLPGFGGGGRAADCQHIPAEFMNRFLIDRPALPAIALTTDTSILTSI